ncbi:MAG: hypothetical protein ACPHL6_06915 [Rubripirellula sp.]
MNDKLKVRSEILARKAEREQREDGKNRADYERFFSMFLIAVSIIFACQYALNLHSLRVLSDELLKNKMRLQTLSLRNDQLNARKTEMREGLIRNGRVIESFFANCRSVEDIPLFNGQHVIRCEKSTKQSRQLFVYVPSGKHQLQVVCQKTATTKQFQAAGRQPTQEESWIVPLVGESSYLFELIYSEQRGEFDWILSSNHPSVTTQKQTVSLQGFRSKNQTHNLQMRDDNIFYTNQPDLSWFYFKREKLTEWEKLATKPVPRNLLRVIENYQSDRDEKLLTEVTVDVRLISEGPISVPASRVSDLIRLGGERLLMPYQGGGKYELRTTR